MSFCCAWLCWIKKHRTVSEKFIPHIITVSRKNSIRRFGASLIFFYSWQTWDACLNIKFGIAFQLEFETKEPSACCIIAISLTIWWCTLNMWVKKWHALKSVISLSLTFHQHHHLHHWFFYTPHKYQGKFKLSINYLLIIY